MRKLTKRQKARNKAKYNVIKRIFEKEVKPKSDLTYKQFKENVKGQLNVKRKRDEKEKQVADFTKDEIKAAAIKESRTDTIWEPWERSRDNLLESLKEKHQDAYSELKNLSRGPGGKYQKIKANLEWDEKRNGYLLNADGKQYYIDITNSPEEVNIIEVA